MGPPMVSKQAQIKSKKRAAESSDDEDIDVQQPPAKKLRDGQKARSNLVHVRVDDGCPLAGRCTSLEGGVYWPRCRE